MGNIHINSLYIETYRGIKNLRLESFTGVNILTGDNNCGKTSVLELLNTMPRPIQISRWIGEIRKTEYKMRSVTYYEGFLDLFSKTDDSEKIIKFEIMDSNNKKHKITISADIETCNVSTRTANRLSNVKFPTEEKSVTANRLNLKFDYNGSECLDYEIYDFQNLLTFVYRKDSAVICKTVFYVSPIEHGGNSNYLKEVLNDSELYPELLSILKEFDEDIISINQYSSQTSTNEYWGILSKKFKNALPLNMYGDGMKKAILLMSAAVAAKGGVLLIDEFETAIHTSAMTKIYSWILKTCKKLDVQLFMTTHSKEALQKVLALNSEPELKDDITLYTLYKKDGKNIARKLSAERAIEADEHFSQELR